MVNTKIQVLAMIAMIAVPFALGQTLQTASSVQLVMCMMNLIVFHVVIIAINAPYQLAWNVKMGILMMVQVIVNM